MEREKIDFDTYKRRVPKTMPLLDADQRRSQSRCLVMGTFDFADSGQQDPGHELGRLLRVRHRSGALGRDLEPSHPRGHA